MEASSVCIGDFFFFVRIPDRYYRVVCRFQDGVRRAKPLARGNSQLNRNSPVYYSVSGFRNVSVTD